MSLQYVPLSRHVGVEVRGMNLHAEVDADTAAELRARFRDHHLLVVRDPAVTSEEQARFARIFGDVVIRGRYAQAPAEADTQYVSNARADGILGDGEIQFHHDHLFYDEPLRAIILYGVEVPASGSATNFRNAIDFFAALPDDLKARCARVRCLQLYDYTGNYTRWQDPSKASPDSPRAWQPLVWTERETGRRALWLSPLNTVDFDGCSREEGFALLDELARHGEAETSCEYRHDWQPGDLVIWNNRTLQHARLPFDPSERRTLRRTPIL